MKRLIACYSRADENYFGGKIQTIEVGNTEKVAHMMAEVIGADLFKIEQKVPYAKKYKTCTEEAKRDKDNNLRPELLALPKNLDEYDEIYLGYPNYWGTMPMAVFTFLESFNWEGKVIYPFCTHEGSGLGNSVSDIVSVAKGAIVKKGLAIVGSKVAIAKEDIKQWLMK